MHPHPTVPRPALHVETLEDRLVPAALDLTHRGDAGFLGGAYFEQADARSLRRERVDTFLRLDGGSRRGHAEQGYNTNARPFQHDQAGGRRVTHALRLDDVPVVTAGGVRYGEFLLDVDERQGRPQVSLDELRVYVGDNPNARRYRPADHTLGGMTPVFDLDAGGDNWVRLSARLNAGRGDGDVLVYVPLPADADGEYVFLYSKFGVNVSADGGSEEWGVGVRGPLGDGVPVSTPTTGTISGRVFDENGSPVLGANVTAFYDANGNGEMDEDEAGTLVEVQTAETSDAATNGLYTLAGLAPTSGVGQYVITAENQGATASVAVALAAGDGLAVDLHLPGEEDDEVIPM